MSHTPFTSDFDRFLRLAFVTLIVFSAVLELALCVGGATKLWYWPFVTMLSGFVTIGVVWLIHWLITLPIHVVDTMATEQDPRNNPWWPENPPRI